MNAHIGGRVLRVVWPALMLVLGAVTPARAQAPSPDPRWTAWLGCWTVSDGNAAGSLSGRSGDQLCVVPTDEAAAVELVTIASGQMTARERLRGDGDRRPLIERGCTGWQAATWSQDGRRLFLWTDSTCDDAGRVQSSGVMAILPNGDWIDLTSVTSRGSTGVRALRYRPSSVSPALPAAIAAGLQADMALQAKARVVASSPIAVDAVIEASRHVDGSAVQAWLLGVGQGFALDKPRLLALAGAKVPDGVIDVVVALSYPHRFSFLANQVARAGPATAATGRTSGGGGVDCRMMPALSNSLDCYASPWAWRDPGGYGVSCLPMGGWGDWLRCGDGFSAAYGLTGPGFYSPRYGYYAYPYGAFYPAIGTWYLGQTPFIVVPGSGTAAPEPAAAAHGRVVNGRGYTQQTGSSSASQPAPTTATPSGSSGGDTSSSMPASMPTSSGGGEERTAKPR